MTNDAILAAAVRLPVHVYHRSFGDGTAVLLNVETGTAHGLNPTGRRMLKVLVKAPDAAAAADELADEFGLPRDELEGDVCDFCRTLLDRSLVELHAPGAVA